MNKTYSIMDPSHSEKINKEKFGQLLSKLGLELTQEELELIWQDFDAELVRFSNIVRRFFKPDEFDRIREVHYKRKIG
jgi:Ca2+-binding EF-hand superfamily protein